MEEYLFSRLGITQIPEKRNYWLVRTNGGQYFEDFNFDNYIGIEWDEIVSADYSDIESLKLQVEEHYPKEIRSGYVASQIDKFVREFTKGDIVIIPNKNSKIFAIGEIAEDSIYIASEENKEGLLFEEDLENQIQFLKKRRKVNWINCFHRHELDNRLQTFIYAHNTIVDLNNYALFIDRTLSDYYIKGKYAYFTFRVNKTSKIALDNMTDLMIFNRKLCQFVNKYFPDDFHINSGEIISKIDVQSKGPVQLSGPIKKILAIGFAATLVCGGTIKFNLTDGIEVSTGGIAELITTFGDLYTKITDNTVNQNYRELQQDYQKLLEEYNSCKQDLLLSTPESTQKNIRIEEQNTTDSDTQKKEQK